MKFAYLSSFFLIAMLFSACSTYQLNTVVSSNTNWKLENDSSFYFHDSLFDISYVMNSDKSFNNLTTSIKIKNNSNEGLIFDWKRSSLILNGQSFSLGNTVMKTVGQYASESLKYNWSKRWSTTSTNGVMNSVSTVSDNSTFIPPTSYIESEKQSFNVGYLSNLQINNPYKNVVLSSDTLIDNTINQVKGSVYDFTQNNSPYSLKLYLTYKVIDKDGKSESDKTLANDFYVSKILEIKKNPYTYYVLKGQRNNIFITSKAN
ncbi:hypothetical protein [Rhizosphaericola mali]|uniref:Lipoprotein n=1 Tax=Rhizosphaericola mali TaxID=2545455 RepID=A0A5P2G732_9BACT|nr:hypothetical protein [Rhizosphaericola mali]QES90508.1 hypothetical protein E0W69_018210 [Rhizosphaericola mali]